MEILDDIYYKVGTPAPSGKVMSADATEKISLTSGAAGTTNTFSENDEPITPATASISSSALTAVPGFNITIPGSTAGQEFRVSARWYWWIVLSGASTQVVSYTFHENGLLVSPVIDFKMGGTAGPSAVVDHVYPAFWERKVTGDAAPKIVQLVASVPALTTLYIQKSGSYISYIRMT